MESKGEILFSKDHTTAKEYMESKAILVVIAVLALNIIFIIAAILSSVTGRLGSGDLPQGNWTRDQMVVCRYNVFTLGLVATVLFVLGAVSIGMVFFTFCKCKIVFSGTFAITSWQRKTIGFTKTVNDGFQFFPCFIQKRNVLWITDICRCTSRIQSQCSFVFFF